MSNLTVHNYKTALTKTEPIPLKNLQSRGFRLVLDNKKEPVRFFGSSSVVFKITDGTTFYALKCYTTDLFNRWEYLKKVQAKLLALQKDWVTPFEIYENEIQVEDDDKKIHSCNVLLMPWLEGERLINLVKLYSSRQSLNEKIHTLSQSFIELAKKHLTQPFSHGDVAPENIIVEPSGKMMLIDHDSFTFEGWNSSVGQGGWSFPYQHPKRNPRKPDLAADHFSFLVLSTSLKALELNPDLFEQFNSSKGLLFSIDDYKHPEHSGLIKELKKIDDLHFQSLLKLLLTQLNEKSISIPGLLNYLEESNSSHINLRPLELVTSESKESSENYNYSFFPKLPTSKFSGNNHPIVPENNNALQEELEKEAMAKEAYRQEQLRLIELQKAEQQKAELDRENLLKESQRQEEMRLAEQQKAEQQRIEQEREEARRQEEMRIAEQQKAEQQRIEQEREEARRQEEMRIAEQQKAEQQRIEQEREEARRQEEMRLAEQQKAEQQRIEQEREETRRQEDMRLAEQQKAEQQRIEQEKERLRLYQKQREEQQQAKLDKIETFKKEQHNGQMYADVQESEAVQIAPGEEKTNPVYQRRRKRIRNGVLVALATISIGVLGIKMFFPANKIVIPVDYKNLVTAPQNTTTDSLTLLKVKEETPSSAITSPVTNDSVNNISNTATTENNNITDSTSIKSKSGNQDVAVNNVKPTELNTPATNNITEKSTAQPEKDLNSAVKEKISVATSVTPKNDTKLNSKAKQTIKKETSKKKVLFKKSGF